MENKLASAVQVCLTQPLYLNVEQLARAIPASRRTLEYWRDEGIIPYIKVGRVIRYELVGVKAALESRFLVKPIKDKPYKIPARGKAKLAALAAAK